MKELISILCPKWKPMGEWTKEDKRAAISFVILAIGIILAGVIENL